jgi:uncharacterized protein involved in exopolysaccharide biosynthesis
LTAVLSTAAEEGSRKSEDGASGAHREDASDDSGPGLRQYLAALRRFWWLALLTFLVVLAASIASLYVIDPVYRAEAEVLIRTEDSQQLFPRTSGSSGAALIRSTGAELIYVQSDAFQSRAVDAAGDGAEVEVRAPVGSSALDATRGGSALAFVAEAGDPEAAVAGAQTWAETYVQARHESDVAEATKLRDLLTGDREALQARQQEVLEPVAALDEAVAVESDPVELSRLLNQRLAIQRTLAAELDPVTAELRRVDAQISSLDIDLRVMEDPRALAYVSSEADLPEERVNGSMTRSVLVGIVAGLVLAGGAVAAARVVRSP